MGVVGILPVAVMSHGPNHGKYVRCLISWLLIWPAPTGSHFPRRRRTCSVLDRRRRWSMCLEHIYILYIQGNLEARRRRWSMHLEHIYAMNVSLT